MPLKVHVLWTMTDTNSVLQKFLIHTISTSLNTMYCGGRAWATLNVLSMHWFCHFLQVTLHYCTKARGWEGSHDYISECIEIVVVQSVFERCVIICSTGTIHWTRDLITIASCLWGTYPTSVPLVLYVYDKTSWKVRQCVYNDQLTCRLNSFS